jgi:inosine-uridine nucleoside N-ribohydrolase
MERKSILPEPLNNAICGGSMRARLMRQLRDIPQLASRRDVLLSTDVGAECDDQAVVAYLALSRAVHLVGIVTSFTPNVAWPYAETTARNTRELLAQLPLKRAPRVVAGSNRPLEEMQIADSAGADFIIRESLAYTTENRLAVLLIGAATDVAAALMRDPTLEDRIEVIAMAFDGWPGGVDPWNVKNDVWAWQVLMESHVPITIGAGDVCKRHLMVSRADAPSLFARAGTPGAVLQNYFMDWTAANPDVVTAMSGQAEHWPIWDLVVVAHLMGHTRSVLYPRPILQDDTTFAQHSARPVPLLSNTTVPSIRWITSLDSAAFWQDFTSTLAEAGRE